MLIERMLVPIYSDCGWRKRRSGNVRRSKCVEWAVIDSLQGMILCVCDCNLKL